MIAIVNIGLGTQHHGLVAAGQASAALQRYVRVQEAAVYRSDTEQTLVAWISRPLEPFEAEEVARELHQQAIAQAVIQANGRDVDVQGELYGPGADAWRPFNPSYFIGLNGQRLA